MTATAAGSDTEVEVDLGTWRRAILTLWWLPVGGLVLGAIVGYLYTFHGGANYKATALISLGQPTSPGGILVPSYGTNPLAVTQIVNAASVQAQAAQSAALRPLALSGHVSVGTVGSAGTGATRTQPLISLTVTGAQPKKIAAAANVLAAVVVERTTARYVSEKIETFEATLANVTRQLAAITSQLAGINRKLAATTQADPLQRLVIVGQQNNAETRQGNLIAQQETLQQQLAFANQVEAARVVVAAAPVAASAHSRSSSLAVGAVIGLILGMIAAIVRRPNRRSA
jgi:uncharacterized protein involved in exopolysaccharide biosynthesis